jgi:hypothetical protein
MKVINKKKIFFKHIFCIYFIPRTLSYGLSYGNIFTIIINKRKVMKFIIVPFGHCVVGVAHLSI